MNTDSILRQFEIIEKSIQRAKLPFETFMMQEAVIDVTLYELMKSSTQIENLIREIDPSRFGGKQVTSYHLPELDEHRLNLCPYCGDPECQSDHK